MEGEEGAASILAWAQSWITPSTLFLLLNLIIGTILVSSKGIARAHRDNHPEEEEEHRAPDISCSTSSLLTRLRSIGSFSRYASGNIPSGSTPPPPAETSPDPDISCSTSSLLTRLRSIGSFSRYASGNIPSGSTPPPPAETSPDPDISCSTSSLLTRLRSIGSFSRYASGNILSGSTPPPPAETSPDPAESEDGSVRDYQLGRSQSETHPKAEDTAAAEGRMHKSASARSVADAAATADRAAEEVDVRADDFINRFRDQLRLQRLDSILRYKDMLNRGR